MFLADSALRRIAACTGDVLTEHEWRRDTGASGPSGDIARLLHKLTLRFNENLQALDGALAGIADLSDAAISQLAGRARIHETDLAETTVAALARIERQHILDELLLDTYRAWRSVHPVRDINEQYELVRAGDPTFGVVHLRRKTVGAWLVFPDAEAATAFDVPYADQLIGDITRQGDYWRPSAYTSPQTAASDDESGGLPACIDRAGASRSLLRWWQHFHASAGRCRTPNQLSAADLAGLAA